MRAEKSDAWWLKKNKRKRCRPFGKLRFGGLLGRMPCHTGEMRRYIADGAVRRHCRGGCAGVLEVLSEAAVLSPPEGRTAVVGRLPLFHDL